MAPRVSWKKYLFGFIPLLLVLHALRARYYEPSFPSPGEAGVAAGGSSLSGSGGGSEGLVSGRGRRGRSRTGQAATVLGELLWPTYPVLPGGLASGAGATSCEVCAVEPELCRTVGEHNLLRAWSYPGTGHRVQAALMRAQERKILKIGVLGGSISAGLHVQPDERYHALVGAWLHEKLPDVVVQVVNGASPAQGSRYFSSCFAAHIGTDADIIIVESAINDPSDHQTRSMYDAALRSLLSLPSRPAVLSMQTFSLADTALSAENSADVFTSVLEYFNVPAFSWRHVVLNQLQRDPAKVSDFFTEDKTHAGTVGHEIMGKVLISYLSTQLCRARRDALSPSPGPVGRWPDVASHDNIPPLRLWDKWSSTANPITELHPPSCLTTNSLSPDHLLKPVAHDPRWKEWESKPEKKYWISSQPGAEIEFAVDVPPSGKVCILRLVSNTFGLGDFRCWWNGEKDKGVDIASWHNGQGYWEARNVGWPFALPDAPPGRQILTCAVSSTSSDPSGKHEVRLIAIMDNLFEGGIVDQPPRDVG